MTRDELVNYIKPLLTESGEMLAERIQNEVPPRGKYTGISVSFWLKDTENIAFLMYVNDVLGDGSTRRLSLGVRRVDSAYKITTPIFKGTNEQTIKFLEFTDEQINEFTEQIMALSDDADERDERFIK